MIIKNRPNVITYIYKISLNFPRTCRLSERTRTRTRTVCNALMFLTSLAQIV